MARYTINIDEQSNAGKHLLSLMKALEDIVKIEEKHQSGIDKALMDVKNGNIHDAKNAEDLISKCLE